MNIACIIPTFNAGMHLVRLYYSFQLQSVQPDVFVVDSSSSDGTKELAELFFKNVIQIPQSHFNHGATRQMLVDLYPNYEFYIFLTQDAYFFDNDSIANLLIPFHDPKVGAVCGRQIPHGNASVFSQHARSFNYPPYSNIRSIEDAPRLGIKSAFLSNSFAAYRGVALRKVGGFPSNVIFAEDMYVASKLLIEGWKISYSSDAKVFHSHNYSVLQEFSRYFDMGVFHAKEPWIRRYFGGAGGEGFRYVVSEFEFLGLKHFYLWPICLIRNFFKLVGFRLGLYEAHLSARLKRLITMNNGYWNH